MTKYPLIRDAVKENGGALSDVMVVSVRDLPEEGDALYAVWFQEGKNLYEGNVQTEDGYKPEPRDTVDVIADTADDPDGFCTIFPLKKDDVPAVESENENDSED